MNESVDPEKLAQIDETMRNREIARKIASDAASKGDPIAGALAALENIAAPFYLGIDSDEDDSDLDVFP